MRPLVRERDRAKRSISLSFFFFVGLGKWFRYSAGERDLLTQLMVTVEAAKEEEEEWRTECLKQST